MRICHVSPFCSDKCHFCNDICHIHLLLLSLLHILQVIIDRSVPYDLFHLNIGIALQNRAHRKTDFLLRVVKSSESGPCYGLFHRALQNVQIELCACTLRDPPACLLRLRHFRQDRYARGILKDLRLDLRICCQKFHKFPGHLFLCGVLTHGYGQGVKSRIIVSGGSGRHRHTVPFKT